jgi:hypothetical protein
MPGGPTDPPVTGTDFWSSAQKQASYTQYDTQTQYKTDGGILQIPLAGVPNTECVLIRLHGGCMRKEVLVQARRLGQFPNLPQLAAQNPSNEVLANFSIVPQAPYLTASGDTYVYQVSASYQFFLENILAPEDGYRMTSAPYTTTPADNNVLTTSNFQTGIL